VFIFTGKQHDGTIIPELVNPAVPQHIISEIHTWTRCGATMQDVVDRLRPRTVPPGYVFHTWKAGKFPSFIIIICLYSLLVCIYYR